ncbi:aminotransferase [Rhodobacter veldkampii DSM 11550]|uniref:Cysteine desulfurase n=1 Tax=Phaeovulum veldkampii DSM 11550 TaxID=1185920 RepID=A0A2T4JAJ3_9RHOB|nr:cysteine desulfurase family protein [Phaeovulum veldkampii]MBK5946451.1 aminotransferase [Phaeovulum veldkampii DSM 11550]PTE14911.1 aminotransferase [Phaeovulum veldkampii DSM 11550]
MRIGQTIYLDHQASTPLDQRVLAKMNPYLVDIFANPHSADHVEGWRAARAVVEAAGQVGELVGADADEIIFTSGATEANNLALLGLARRSGAGRRCRILLGAAEHKCVLAAGGALRDQLGFKIEHIPVDFRGHVDPDTLEAMIGDDVLMVSVMAVNNEVGAINDIDAIAAICRANGVILHCDAAQAPCAIDLKTISEVADLVSLSGHKMYGPKGIGALMVRRELQNCIEPIIYGGGQQGNLRSGTLPVALCVGMGAAAALCSDAESVNERQRISGLRDHLVRSLEELPWETILNGPSLDRRHPGNANVMFPGLLAQDILGGAQPLLCASTGSACTSGIPEPSHVLRAMGLDAASAEASIRFSVGRRTTRTDIDDAVKIVHDSVSKLSESRVSLAP